MTFNSDVSLDHEVLLIKYMEFVMELFGYSGIGHANNPMYDVLFTLDEVSYLEDIEAGINYR